MSKKTKIWSVGDGISIVYIEDEALYIKISYISHTNGYKNRKFKLFKKRYSVA